MKQEMIGWQWHQLNHMQIICASLQTDNPPQHIAQFLQAGCPSWRQTNSVKASKAYIKARKQQKSNAWIQELWGLDFVLFHWLVTVLTALRHYRACVWCQLWWVTCDYVAIADLLPILVAYRYFHVHVALTRQRYHARCAISRNLQRQLRLLSSLNRLVWTLSAADALGTFSFSYYFYVSIHN